MRRNQAENNLGFTLIEILISLTILVIGLVGILALFPTSIRSSRDSQDNSGTYFYF